MATETDQIVAATLTAAMLRTIEPTGSLELDAKQRTIAIQFAERLYRDLLAAIQAAPAQPTEAGPPSTAQD